MSNVLSAESVSHLSKLAYQTMRVKKNTYLFREGQDGDRFFIVLKGKFQVNKLSGDGKQLCLRLCGPNSIMGELMVFSQNGKYLFSGKALEESEVLVIKNEAIEKELLVNPEFAAEFMRVMTDHIRKQHTKFRDLVLYGKKGALYSTLIRMVNSYGKEIDSGILLDVQVTNQDLANFSSTTRESVNRTLNELKGMGILSFEGRKIIIHDLEYLKQEINCENCPASYCNIE
ncbi:Crp/Fnr family transcriptional regulator [Ectobacillus ponti]|uniref:Crp/Fnr family transcriptional regulator n=1 Tax=Ectobacillus ponti TaxID=2961894 RepID=A0AA41X241_9BACI|nr:Crp/Fnr family transcriptional regulator [Ectobacillus ponti]MCP8967529.1 Crp/Fnr family transcriptional regulator [Ectobacillus ponti]